MGNLECHQQRSESMVNSEADLRQLLQTRKDAHCHLSFVESHLTSSGIPDIAYTIDGITGWLELKYGTPARAPHLRLSQRQWFKDNVSAGGMPLLLLASRRGNSVAYGLIRGELYAEMYQAKTLKKWESLCGYLTVNLDLILILLTTPVLIPIRR